MKRNIQAVYVELRKGELFVCTYSKGQKQFKQKYRKFANLAPDLQLDIYKVYQNQWHTEKWDYHTIMKNSLSPCLKFMEL